jgi:hypothetical protein
VLLFSPSSFPSFAEPLSSPQNAVGVRERVIGFFIGFIHRVRVNGWLTFHVSWEFTFNEPSAHV